MSRSTLEEMQTAIADPSSEALAFFVGETAWRLLTPDSFLDEITRVFGIPMVRSRAAGAGAIWLLSVGPDGQPQIKVLR